MLTCRRPLYRKRDRLREEDEELVPQSVALFNFVQVVHHLHSSSSSDLFSEAEFGKCMRQDACEIHAPHIDASFGIHHAVL